MILALNRIEAQRSGFDSEKEEECHRSMWCRLRRHMTLWCSSDAADRVGFDLPCGAGRLAALGYPRQPIHYRSGSNPLQVFQKRSPRHKAEASLLADRVGFPACGRARARL